MPSSSKCQTSKHRRIGVISNCQHSFGKSLLKGVNSYIEEAGENYIFDIYPDLLSLGNKYTENCHGIIAAVDDAILSNVPSGFPVINLNGELCFSQCNKFKVDDYRVGEIAAELFREKGIVSYFYYDGFGKYHEVPGKQVTSLRLKGFKDRFLQLQDDLIKSTLTEQLYNDDTLLEKWLLSAPKPIGVLCFNDLAAIELLEICRHTDLLLPEEVMIVGVDNSELLCNIANPSITSIDLNVEQITYQAIGAITDFIENREEKRILNRVEPILIERESTGKISSEDFNVKKALSLIENRIAEYPTPTHLAKQIGCSVRSLNLSLKKELNTTTKDLIQFSIYRQAQFFLRESELSIESIADKLNLDARYLYDLFKRLNKSSPGDYRNSFRSPQKINITNRTTKTGSPTRTIGFISSLGKAERSILSGIEHYIRTQNRKKDIRILPRFESVQQPVTETHIRRLTDDFFDECDALIVASDSHLPQYSYAKAPIISIDHIRNHGKSWPVFSNNKEIGATAAKYFIKKGYKSFAYSGLSAEVLRAGLDLNTSAHKQRQVGFENELRKNGFNNISILDCRFNGEQEAKEWLQSLEKPLGLFAFNDFVAMKRLNEALTAGLKVPDEVAILGADNEQILCESTHPSISTIEISFVKAGYDIAALLLQLIEYPSQTKVEIEHIRSMQVIERESTNAFGFQDVELRKAILTAKEYCSKNITVEDMVAATQLTRRSIEVRAKKHLGMTLHQILCYERTQLAIKLLMSSNHNINEISTLSGFESNAVFFRVFKSFTGESPASYRKQRVI